MTTLRNKIIATMRQHGADIVGFGNIERFNDGIIQKIFPETRTVIGGLFRILRGSHRGIEEGTTYYQYTTTAVETLEETIMPMAMQRSCAVLENNDFSALPQTRNQLIMVEKNSTNPEMNYEEIYRDKKTELQLNFSRTAQLCGLGELGLYGNLLSDDFGPLQRYCFILTDAELEPSPLIEAHLCDKCGKCIDACPGKAISASGKIDLWQCAAYYKGANMHKNPFMPPETFADDQNCLEIISGTCKLSPERAREIIDQLNFYPSFKQGYTPCICGKSCDRECYIHLEEKGLLNKSFKSNFRKRPEWELPIQ